MSIVPLFDNRRRRKNINRAAPCFSDYDFLFKKAADSLVERISFIKHPPSSTLIFGARENYLYKGLKSVFPNTAITHTGETAHSFPFELYDCIISNLCLHWENDLPRLLQQIHAGLKPGGFFLSSFFGENTMAELRRCMIETESSLCGCVSPRISPSIDIKSAGKLLQAARFKLPVADCETYAVVHSDIFDLIHDLRGMGETNALSGSSKKPLTKTFFRELGHRYTAVCGLDEGGIETRFDILYIVGWKE